MVFDTLRIQARREQRFSAASMYLSQFVESGKRPEFEDTIRSAVRNIVGANGAREVIIPVLSWRRSTALGANEWYEEDLSSLNNILVLTPEEFRSTGWQRIYTSYHRDHLTIADTGIGSSVQEQYPLQISVGEESAGMISRGMFGFKGLEGFDIGINTVGFDIVAAFVKQQIGIFLSMNEYEGTIDQRKLRSAAKAFANHYLDEIIQENKRKDLETAAVRSLVTGTRKARRGLSDQEINEEEVLTVFQARGREIDEFYQGHMTNEKKEAFINELRENAILRRVAIWQQWQDPQRYRPSHAAWEQFSEAQKVWAQWRLYCPGFTPTYNQEGELQARENVSSALRTLEQSGDLVLLPFIFQNQEYLASNSAAIQKILQDPFAVTQMYANLRMGHSRSMFELPYFNGFILPYITTK